MHTLLKLTFASRSDFSVDKSMSGQERNRRGRTAGVVPTVTATMLLSQVAAASAADSVFVCGVDQEVNEVILSALPEQLPALLAAGASLVAANKADNAVYRLRVPDGLRVQAIARGHACDITLKKQPAVGQAPTKDAVGKVAGASSPEKASETDKTDGVTKAGGDKKNGDTAQPAKEENYVNANSWSVPASPAFEIINVNPNLASLPSTPREIAMHLAGGRAADGTIQKGIAIDASLSQVLRALSFMAPELIRDITRPKAKDGPNVAEKAIQDIFSNKRLRAGDLENRFVDRVKLSLATTQEENKTGAPVNLGVGLQYVLWDYADRNTICTKKELDGNFATDKPSGREIECKKIGQERKLAAAKAEDDNIFASTASAIGVANAYALKDGRWSNRKLETRGVWLTLASPGLEIFGKPKGMDANSESAAGANLQLIAHYRRFRNQVVPQVDKADGTKTNPNGTERQDSNTTALRMKLGMPKGAASYEFSRASVNPLMPGQKSTRMSRRSYGIEWQVGKDIWLVASAGREWSQDGVIKNQPFVITTLRFGEKAMAIGDK